MFQWFFDEGEGVELKKLVGFGKIGSSGVQVLPEGSDFFLGDRCLGLERGVDVVDEEVDSEVEL